MADQPRAETIARRFHETYERLAPRFGYETRRESAVRWEQVPERNRKLMVAVVADLLDKGVIVVPPPCGYAGIFGPCVLPKGHRSAHRGSYVSRTSLPDKDGQAQSVDVGPVQ